MLIRFRFKNFLSYKNDTVFSMIKSSERSHPNHIIDGKFVSVLKGAVLYGANASGKSNFLKAVSTAQALITQQRDKNTVLPNFCNKLYESCNKTPTEFEFEFEHKEEVYAYGFSWTPEKIHEEWLYKLGKTVEEPIFDRKNGIIHFKKENTELTSIGLKTPDRQLFMNFLNQMDLKKSQNNIFDDYQNCFDWFKNALIIISPQDRFAGWARMNNNEVTKEFMKKSLCSFGIEVSDIEFSPMNISQLPLPKPVIDGIAEKLLENEGIAVPDKDYNFYILKKQNGELNASELKFIHASDNNAAKPFSFSEESDGTKRLTDFLPLFLILNDHTPNTIFIDEIERSLHTELTCNLMKQFLSIDGKDQIITTTHASCLLNTDILRRDEIWFSEKSQIAGSVLYALSDFKPRKDKDIRKDYLAGRYGAIPFFTSNIDSLIGEVYGMD